MEELTRRVSRSERTKLLIKELEKGNRTNDKAIKYSLNPLMDHIAEMMKLAYLAGYTAACHEEDPSDKETYETGQALIGAINFAKDKGYII